MHDRGTASAGEALAGTVPILLKLHEKMWDLENLDEIEPRLARPERTFRITLVVMIPAALASAMLLDDILAPSWLPLGH